MANEISEIEAEKPSFQSPFEIGGTFMHYHLDYLVRENNLSVESQKEILRRFGTWQEIVGMANRKAKEENEKVEDGEVIIPHVVFALDILPYSDHHSEEYQVLRELAMYDEYFNADKKYTQRYFPEICDGMTVKQWTRRGLRKLTQMEIDRQLVSLEAEAMVQQAYRFLSPNAPEEKIPTLKNTNFKKADILWSLGKRAQGTAWPPTIVSENYRPLVKIRETPPLTSLSWFHEWLHKTGLRGKQLGNEIYEATTEALTYWVAWRTFLPQRGRLERKGYLKKHGCYTRETWKLITMLEDLIKSGLSDEEVTGLLRDYQRGRNLRLEKIWNEKMSKGKATFRSLIQERARKQKSPRKQLKRVFANT